MSVASFLVVDAYTVCSSNDDVLLTIPCCETVAILLLAIGRFLAKACPPLETLTTW